MGDLVLGIETSCDDTSVALVDQNGQIAAIETVSQYEVHSEFGGVYPELASRAHLEAILPTIETVMARAGVGRLDLRAIGVTRGPARAVWIFVPLGLRAGRGSWDRFWWACQQHRL
jgi:N6-L-threonylcarbamoyladenine synthase